MTFDHGGAAVKPTGEREAFEAWYRDTFSNANSFDLRHDEVAYAYREVDMAWRAWQAAATAHAALVAELDKRTGHLLEREKELRSADSELKRAWDERDALTARCAELEAWADGPNGVKWYIQQAADLRAKLQAAERDAARYRWWGENALKPEYRKVLHDWQHNCHDLGASIDAALAQSAKP